MGRLTSTELEKMLNEATSFDSAKKVAMAAISTLKTYESESEDNSDQFFGPNGHYGWDEFK